MLDQTVQQDGIKGDDMFNFLKSREENQVLKGDIVLLKDEIKTLEKDRAELKREIEDLKIKKKISEEDIKHMVRMKEEKNNLEYEKRVAKIEKEKDNEIARVKDEYRDKIEKRLENETKNIKEMYGDILQRLPNVNVRLKGDV
jgi:chromosome segregation ATPase